MLQDLNPEQQRAVKCTGGRVLILAGAGSGKTTVLARRIAYLIHEIKVSPRSILGLTFTNKAAEEMRERVAKMAGKQHAKQVTLCTFHSFCMQVLRKEIHHLGYTSEFSLYDERDVKRLMKTLARHLLQHEGDLPSLESTIEKISFAKNKGAETLSDGFVKEIYNSLEVCMRAYNALDFDSLLTLTLQLFEQFPDVLKKYQDRFRYIMIDEYQDTNPVQFQIASLLAQGHHNLCVVGDDDQSIYGWRGAEIKNILQFQAAETIKLEQNYRSTPNILHAANAVIRNNQERHNKQLWSTQEQGTLVELFHAPTEAEEAQGIALRIAWLHKHKKIQWNEMAVLYRSNILSRQIEQALMQAVWQNQEGGETTWMRGIPYQVFGGTELYERSEVKDLMAYLKVIANPLDEEALLRIINVPRRGISEKTLDILTQKNRTEKIPLYQVLLNLKPDESLPERAVKCIESFTSIIEEAKVKFKEEPLNLAFSWLLERINYKKAIQEDVKSDKMRSFKWENVVLCLDAIKQYETEMAENQEENSLQHFLSLTLLDQEKFIDRQKDHKKDRVNLMTFHSAKGLEFKACFLIGLEDHILPHEKSFSLSGIEEERRLMYVAMTRAKQFLTLSMAQMRKRMGKDHKSSPSRFLFEIPKDLVQINPWNKTG